MPPSDISNQVNREVVRQLEKHAALVIANPASSVGP